MLAHLEAVIARNPRIPSRHPALMLPAPRQAGCLEAGVRIGAGNEERVALVTALDNELSVAVAELPAARAADEGGVAL